MNQLQKIAKMEESQRVYDCACELTLKAMMRSKTLRKMLEDETSRLTGKSRKKSVSKKVRRIVEYYTWLPVAQDSVRYLLRRLYAEVANGRAVVKHDFVKLFTEKAYTYFAKKGGITVQMAKKILQITWRVFLTSNLFGEYTEIIRNSDRYVIVKRDEGSLEVICQSDRV